MIASDHGRLVADSLNDFVGWEIICRTPFKPGVEMVTARRLMDNGGYECINVYTSVQQDVKTPHPSAPSL